MAERDLYEILGVSRSASDKEIRSAYRALARKYHPDRNQGDKQAEERFKEASYASTVLLDPKKRALYDEFGEVGLKDGFDAEAYRRYAGGGRFTNLEDLFGRTGGAGGMPNFAEMFGEDVMGSVFGQRGRRSAAAREVRAEITVDFAEALRGAERELSISGLAGSLKVRIPAGVEDGGKVRLRGRGAGGGDVVLVVHVRKHRFFRREGNDLLLDLPVSVGEAFKGARVEVPTADGSVTLTLPAQVRGGSKLRLRGKGVKRGASVGDLIVQVQVVLPKVDEATREAVGAAVETLESAYDGSVRADLEL